MLKRLFTNKPKKKMEHSTTPLQFDWRKYYAAHAPEVPDWFEPVLGEEPEPLNLFSHFNSPQEQEWLKYFHGAGATQEDQWPYNEPAPGIPQSFKDEVSAYLVEIDKRYEEIHVFKDQEQIQKVIQWRFYYAEQMVNQSNKIAA